MKNPENQVIIKKGSVLVYRIFDIAEEIDMTKAEGLLKNVRGPDTFRVPRFIDRGLLVKSRPLTFGLGHVDVGLDCGSYRMEVSGKVRDFGVLSLVYEIPMKEGTTWDELLALAVDLEEGSEIDQISQRHTNEVTERIHSALKKPVTWSLFEDYIIYNFEQFGGDTNAMNLLDRADVAALLLAEDDTVLAPQTRESVLKNIYQYGEGDLAIVEWNAALVVEEVPSRDEADILEFAVTQLLEMRFYDDLLDKRLAALYDDIERSKNSVLRAPFAQIYQDASTRYIEFSEFIERVENSLKVVGDFYLATVYRAATRKFRLADWQENITRKMNLLAQVSSLLQGEVNIRRSHWMEITIIALIAFEIVSAVWKFY
jgi:hypothetical protein